MLRQRDLHSEQPRTTVPNIIGYDANALYLWALDQSMPTGPYIRRRADTKIRGEVIDKYKSAYYLDGMDYLRIRQTNPAHVTLYTREREMRRSFSR